MRELKLLLDEGAPLMCRYSTRGVAGRLMPLSLMKAGIAWAEAEGMSLSVIYGGAELPAEYVEVLAAVEHQAVVPIAKWKTGDMRAIVVADLDREDDRAILDRVNALNVVVRMSRESIGHLSGAIESLMGRVARIEVLLVDPHRLNEGDLRAYSEALSRVGTTLVEAHTRGGNQELNVLTDMFGVESRDCGAGLYHITLAPDGWLYLCPGFFANTELGFGRIAAFGSPIRIPDERLLRREFSPLCRVCDARHCSRCVYLNRLSTDEVNIPGEQQCVAAHLEREASASFLDALHARGLKGEVAKIEPLDYCDPFEIVVNPRRKGEREGDVTLAVGQFSEAAGKLFFDRRTFPEYGTRGTFEELYDVYIDNLEKCPYEKLWLEPEEFASIRISSNYDVVSRDALSSIRDSDVVKDVAARLVSEEMGTYWPLFAYRDHDGYLCIRDDEARFEAFKALADEGVWTSRLLVLTDSVQGDENEIRYSIPAPWIVVAEFKALFPSLYASVESDAGWAGRNSIVEVPGLDGYTVLTAWRLLLQGAFLEYAAAGGAMIAYSKFVNGGKIEHASRK